MSDGLEWKMGLDAGRFGGAPESGGDYSRPRACRAERICAAVSDS